MTEKEAIIKLFKLKMQENSFTMDISNGEVLSGCSFRTENGDKNFIGISTSRPVIGFNNIITELEEHEYQNLKRFFEQIKGEHDRKQAEIRNNKIIKDLKVLSEIASKENFDESRRVLTEKHTEKTKFKF
jgi:hypothetical protein